MAQVPFKLKGCFFVRHIYTDMKIRIYIGLLTLIIVMSILSNINWANIPSVTYAANKLRKRFRV